MDLTLLMNHSPTEIFGIVVAAVLLFLSAPGGVGGGGILLPVYMMVLQFTAKKAVGLTNITVLGGALANTYFNIKKRHPSTNQPLIDWDVLVLFEPATIAGTVIGSFANKVLPGWVLIAGLVVVLGYISYRTIKKGIELFNKESKVPVLLSSYVRANLQPIPESAAYAYGSLNMRAKRASRELERKKALSESTNSLTLTSEEETDNQRNPALSIDASAVSADLVLLENGNKLEEKDEQEELKGHSVEKILALVLLFFGVSVLNILKGGEGFPSPIGIPCGSMLFWLLTALIFAKVIGFTAYYRAKILKKSETKYDSLGSLTGFISWDHENTVKYPCLCTFAGLFAGLFGIGGGIVKSPLMLELGFHPSVASACSATMILFTSSSACVSFFVFGQLEVHSALFFLIFGFTCTTVGQVLSDFILQRSGRTSVIVLSMGVIIAASTVCVTIQTVMSLVLGEASSHSGNVCA